MIGSAARFAEPIEYPAYLAYDAFPTRKQPADGTQSRHIDDFQSRRPRG